MVIANYMNFHPWDELQSAWQRVPSEEYSDAASLEGRVMCVWRMCSHTIALVVKPVLYITVGLIFIAGASERERGESRLSEDQIGVNVILAGLVAPLGQIWQIFKAAMGILYPGFYFKKEDEFSPYFNQLVAIAEEVGCEADLIHLLKEGPYIISSSLFLGLSRAYYHALFKRDLAIVCEKLKDPALSPDEKMSVLNMFAPLASDPSDSAIHACQPGLGRLLEQICACLDVPKQLEKVMPWLVAQYKQEIIHRMIMQNLVGIETDSVHVANILIVSLGKKIELPQEMIEKASYDLVANVKDLPEREQANVLDRFHEFYTEEALVKYFMDRINSQPDGRPGLKDFRNYIIQKLAEHVSESEIADSKDEVMNTLGVGEALADDPVFYVKLHYYLYPDADPSDETASDLNEEGMRAFAATLEDNPFHYFKSE